jgi:hypothetical protein
MGAPVSNASRTHLFHAEAHLVAKVCIATEEFEIIAHLDAPAAAITLEGMRFHAHLTKQRTTRGSPCILRRQRAQLSQIRAFRLIRRKWR